MKIFIGADHAGYEFKEKIKVYLTELGLGYEVIDKGAFSYNPEDDYPDFIQKVALAVAESASKEEESFGVIIGGSGQGEAMCANRTKGVRAAVFYGEVLPKNTIDIKGQKSADSFEIIKLEREHNNANVLSIGERFVTEDEAKFAIELFLSTPFGGDERHEKRIAKF
ncbi:MAG TPA: RpiB/LacA/LacB family sugar-phosphate isomerase [Candidatus Paceibacterota bacterium]|jgi:ribose 5-phosphate isomerase B|nr:RpiB/LacA/LacB family sugar-phosphate isomerase [Candidatus Paceibacterota bacterium]